MSRAVPRRGAVPRLVLAALVACVAYEGCATADPYVIGGTSLSLLGESYVAAVPPMDVACEDGGTATPAQCDTWKNIATGFRLGFGPAVDLLNAADKANDPELRAAASQALTHLRTTLAPYVVAARATTTDGGVP